MLTQQEKKLLEDFRLLTPEARHSVTQMVSSHAQRLPDVRKFSSAVPASDSNNSLSDGSDFL